MSSRSLNNEFLDAYDNNDVDVCKSLVEEWNDSDDTNYAFAIILSNYLIYGKDTNRRLKINFGMIIKEMYHTFLLSSEIKPKNEKLASKYEAKVGVLALMEKMVFFKNYFFRYLIQFSFE